MKLQHPELIELYPDEWYGNRIKESILEQIEELKNWKPDLYKLTTQEEYYHIALLSANKKRFMCYASKYMKVDCQISVETEVFRFEKIHCIFPECGVSFEPFGDYIQAKEPKVVYLFSHYFLKLNELVIKKHLL